MSAALGPVLVGLAVGLLLRRGGIAGPEHGRFLLQLNFYVCLPALVLPAVAGADVGRGLLVFPAAAVVMVAVGYAVGRLVARASVTSRQDRAVVTTSFMVVNCAFALPFVGAVHGTAGVVRVAAFDLVHGLLVATVALAVAARADPTATPDVRRLGGQLLRTPLLHATAIGALLNLAGLPLPAVVAQGLAPFATASLAVVALGCGLVLEPLQDRARIGSLALARLAAGLVSAAVLVLALGLEGTDRGVLLMLGATPLGFVVVTFAATHRLGTRLSSNLLLASLALSVVVYGGVGLAVG